MRVIDCDECGETLQAADDGELVRTVREHYAEEHDAIDEARAAQLVDGGAYDAMDS